MQKRGQVAMEFLMTYGWAIIIILLAIAALWLLGVFSPSVTTTCQLEAPFSCQDAIIDEAGLTLKVGIGANEKGSITSIEVNGNPCAQLIGSTDIESSKLSNIRCVLSNNLKKNEKVTVTIKATTKQPGGLTHNIEGTISGQASKISYAQSGDPSLIAAYSFENDGEDTSLNNNDGTLVGGLTCNAQGKVGTACNFDGADDYISVKNDQTLDATSSMSISAWIKTSSTSTNSILQKGSNCIIHQDRWFRYSNGNLILRSYVSDSDYYLYGATGTIHDDKFHHVAVTAIDDNLPKFYVDGIETAPDTDNWHMEDVPTTYDITIGASSVDCDNIPNDELFTGIIDELAIYNRVLTPEEIKAHAAL